jgi:hypothetical protein
VFDRSQKIPIDPTTYGRATAGLFILPSRDSVGLPCVKQDLQAVILESRRVGPLRSPAGKTTRPILGRSALSSLRAGGRTLQGHGEL